MQFNDLDHDPSLPINAYSNLIHGPLKSRLTFRYNNLANAEIQFPPYFSSWQAMESGTVQCFEHLTQHLPRLKFISGQLGSPPIPVIRAMENHVEEVKIINLDSIKELEIGSVKTLQGTLPFGLKWPGHIPDDERMAAFTVTNLSQSHRNTQAAFHAQCQQWLVECSRLLSEWCAISDAFWSLRPILNMPGNDESSLQALSYLRGIQYESNYLSLSNLQALNYLIPIHHHVFHPLASNFIDDPNDRFNEYKWWANNCYTAAIRLSNGDTLGLVPAGLPPQLVESIRHSIPVYVHHRLGSILLNDQCVITTRADNERLNDEDFWRIKDEEYMLSKSTSIMGLLLQAIATLTTLNIAPYKWGRGHRRPAWVYSSPNQALIQSLAYTIPFIIANATRFIEAK